MRQVCCETTTSSFLLHLDCEGVRDSSSSRTLLSRIFADAQEAHRSPNVVEFSQMLLPSTPRNGGRGMILQDTRKRGVVAHRACPYQKGKKRKLRVVSTKAQSDQKGKGKRRGRGSGEGHEK